MPFVPNTPESLIGRTDSKNPTTTCRGITSGGRPCRRPLNATPDGSQPAPPVVTPRGRTNQLRVDDPRDPDLYCWQHKEQAKSSARSSPGPASRNKLGTIRQGSVESLESLIGRLGIVEAERTGRKQNGNTVKPSYNQGTEKPSQPNYSNGPNPSNFQQEGKPRKSRGFCCCFTSPVLEEEEEEQPSRPSPRPVQATPMKPGAAKLPSNQHLAPPSGSQRPSIATSKQSSGQSATSQTSQYLSLIPPSALPETAATLMKELSKPYAVNDEPGYIYIFWLTPESQSSDPPTDVAKNLLTPHPRPEMRQRGTSDVLRSYATQSTKTTQAGAPAKTILVKIGRASNVQRRMNEWQRQCGYNLSLIRYYPYISSSQPSTPRKMPHSHKVERLIHIELEGQGLRVKPKASCDTCGKNHREWFEVEATRAGINTIDEVVRRWSDWDEGNPQRFQQ